MCLALPQVLDLTKGYPPFKMSDVAVLTSAFGSVAFLCGSLAKCSLLENTLRSFWWPLLATSPTELRELPFEWIFNLWGIDLCNAGTLLEIWPKGELVIMSTDISWNFLRSIENYWVKYENNKQLLSTEYASKATFRIISTVKILSQAVICRPINIKPDSSGILNRFQAPFTNNKHLC